MYRPIFFFTNACETRVGSPFADIEKRLGPLYCALVREEAIFAACKRCANESYACMCKEKYVETFRKLMSVEFSKFFRVGHAVLIVPYKKG